MQQYGKRQGVKTIEQHKKLYDKLMNNVYETIKQKQLHLRKKSISQVPPSLPKLCPKDFMIDLQGNDKTLAANKNKVSSQSTSRCKIYKSFLLQLDQQQRKINHQNMNLLGLEIKKITYEKSKPKQKQQSPQFQSINLQCMNENCITTPTILVNTVDFQMQINNFKSIKKDPIRKQSINTKRNKSSNNRKNSFRLKERQIITAGRVSNQKVQKKRILVNSEYVNPIYENRINSYRQLIFKINFAHKVYIDFNKFDSQQGSYVLKSQHKYRAWIGPGNNGALVKSIMKKRFWWVIKQQKILDKFYDIDFIWTQLKVNEIFKRQTPAPIQIYNTKVDYKNNQDEETKIQTSISHRKRKSFKKQQIKDQQYFYKVFNESDDQFYKAKMMKYGDKDYKQKKEILNLKEISNENIMIHNHLMNNFYLGNKKALFYNLKQYYQLIQEFPFKKIPLTFHIKTGLKDIEYKRFVSYFRKRQSYIKKQDKAIQQGEITKRKMRNVWIVKPGQLTNRGNGITVIDEIYELNNIIKRQGKHQNGLDKTFIVQLYLDKPFLYQKRKFDLRHYILITHLHGIMRGYWFEEGYIRTTSYEFDIENFDREVHLTNDAVQKYSPLYGKYQLANKISYSEFQRYLDTTYPQKKYNFFTQVLPKMKQISTDAVKSAFLKLSPQRLQHNFQIFGLDFMIDAEFKPWLIQINTNPCLELPCPLLARIIPQMLDQAFRLSLDVIFPPPCHYPNTAKHLVPEASLENMRFQLIFDQKRDGGSLRNLYKKGNINLLDEIGEMSDDEVYQDDGKQVGLDDLLEL